jgi:hypothetical protein
MKKIQTQLLQQIILMCGLLALPAAVHAQQNIFISLYATSGTASRSTVTAAPPSGASHSAAAPVQGNIWNFVTVHEEPANTTAGTYALYSSGPSVLVDPVSGSTITPAYTVYDILPVTESHANPSTGSGENSIQPGGVMRYCMRNYGNGSTFTSSSTYISNVISGLPASTPFNLYYYGGTTTSGQAGNAVLAAANVLGSDVSTNATTNTTANTAGAYGSIWTGTSPNYTLMPEGTTWNVLQGQSDANGNFAFLFGAGGTIAYNNGFQLVQVPITFSVTGGGTDCASPGVAVGLSGSESAASYQLYNNGSAVGSPVTGTGAAISFPNATVSGTYTVVASYASGASSTMSGSAAVTISPATTVSLATDPNQTAQVGSTVTISVTTGGTAPTTYVWAKNGVTLSDGRQTSGSTISDSGTASLTITDVQLGDAATAAQGGYTCTVSGGCGAPTSAATALTVTSANTPPTLYGLTNQTVVVGSDVTLAATYTGSPTPAFQWWLSTDGGVTSNVISGQTTATLLLTDVQYNQPSYIYTLVATNVAGVVASNMTLTVIVPPIITVEPVSEFVSATSNASFTVVSANGVPAPSFQWYTNNVADPNGTSATYTITNAQLANDGTYYVVVSNAAGSVTSDSVTLTVFPLGSPVWTGANSATDLNWSDGANWLGGTGLGGVPGPSDNVSFFDYGATNYSQAQVDDIFDSITGDFSGTIASLQYGNTNGFHTTQIADGLTLNVTGSNGLKVFTPGDTGVDSDLYVAIIGANGTLNLNNTNANLVVNEGTASTTTPTAMLDMSGLGTFTANINRLGLATAYLPSSGGSANRLSGNLYLALTNTITLNYAQPASNYLVGGTTNALEMAANKNNGANETYLYLGQQNQFFVDSIGVGRDKSTSGRYEAFMEFNPNGSFTSPTACFRGIGGSSSRVTWWGIGDMNANGSSAQAACGLVDFTDGVNADGILDAMVGTMSLGRDGTLYSSHASAVNSGTLNFTIGTLNVNTLILGNQSLGLISNLDTCVGLLNINGGNNPAETNAMLIVNNNLILGNTTLNSPAAQGTYGVLTVNNGTVFANNISVGAFTTNANNGISLTGSTLLVSNSLATSAPGLASLTLNSSLLGLPVNANATPSAVVQTLNNGGGNLIQIMSVPVFPSYPTNIMLIQCSNNASGISGLSLASNEPPGAAGASLVLDADGQSIDIQFPQPVTISSFGLNNGHLEMTVNGGSQSLNYEIQTSTNLTTWVTVFTNNSPTLPFQYVDPGLIATNHALFYRVVAGSSLP